MRVELYGCRGNVEQLTVMSVIISVILDFKELHVFKDLMQQVLES